MASTSLLGLGNVLMGDDGFGPAVVHAFESTYVIPPDLLIVDLGTPGLDLSPWLMDAARVVLVDTVKADLPPGTLRIYEKADVLRYAPSVRVGPHDPGVKEALLALEFAGRGPRELTLVGVVPARTELSLELTPALQRAVPSAVAAIAAMLECRGIVLEHRQTPSAEWRGQGQSAAAIR
jgi:hydrogenase maturation protease